MTKTRVVSRTAHLQVRLASTKGDATLPTPSRPSRSLALTIFLTQSRNPAARPGCSATISVSCAKSGFGVCLQAARRSRPTCAISAAPAVCVGSPDGDLPEENWDAFEAVNGQPLLQFACKNPAVVGPSPLLALRLGRRVERRPKRRNAAASPCAGSCLDRWRWPGQTAGLPRTWLQVPACQCNCSSAPNH